MALSTFIIRLIFLAIPGIVASKFYRKLRGPTRKEQWESVLEIALFSISCYLLLIPAVMRWPSLSKPVDMWSNRSAPEAKDGTAPPKTVEFALDAFVDESARIPPLQVAFAVLAAMPIAVIAGYLHKFRVVTLCGRILGATGRMADEDVWELFFTARKVKWILLRDHKYSLAYYGLARFYSDSDRDREVVLENVTVYNNLTAKKIYDVPTMYLCRPKDELTIELPALASSQAPTDADSQPLVQATAQPAESIDVRPGNIMDLRTKES